MAQQLPLFSEAEFEHRAPEGFPVGCPTVDLSTTSEAGGKNVFIHRPPGQVVSKIHQVAQPGGTAPEALAVTWRADGQFLAVGWSDGVVRLMGLENNKAAHRMEICPQSDAKIAYIGWACSNITNRTSSLSSSLLKQGLSEEWKTLNGDDPPADLPRQLTFLEIETALPKISPLPASSAGDGEDAIVFTLRTGIEFLFQTPRPEEYDQVNVMVVGTSDGQLHLSIYDSFVIGSFMCPSLIPGAISQLISHTSNHRVSTHALLMAEQTSRQELYLLPLDLPFLSSVPINLSLLASKLTTLQKLLRYLKQTQLHMQFEWKNTRELPSRFLRSVEAGLEDQTGGPQGIVSALYHTAVTGHVYEPVREWLVDSLAERGHKRWDKAVVSGLENLRSLVHENFLPALERCSIILSRLRGLAQFHDAREDIGFSVTQISKAMDIISCLNLVGHKILLVVMDELDHFTAFSTWLRFQIDRLASCSSEGEELTEKEATMDNLRVLVYIERYLTDSPLRIFFDQMAEEDYTADWNHIEDGPSLLDVLNTQLKKHEGGQDAMKALPHVEFLTDYASHWCSRIFKDIADAKRRSVRFGKPVKLTIGRKIDNFDIRMCEDGSNGATVYTAVASRDTSNQVHIFRASLDIINGISSNRSVTCCLVDLGDRRLVNLKFLGDRSLVLLCNDTNNSHVIITVPLKLDMAVFSSFDESNLETHSLISCDGFPMYRLPGEQPSRSVWMEVHDRADVRGEIPARICLLKSNRTTWQTFVFPGQD